MSMRIRVVPGFGEEHREMSMGAKDRHEFEVWERLIGLPQRAEVNSHANDDGVITRQERKAIERAKTQELHVRHRGAMGYAPIRTAVWAKGTWTRQEAWELTWADGLRERVRNIGDAVRGKEKRTWYSASGHKLTLQATRRCSPRLDLSSRYLSWGVPTTPLFYHHDPVSAHRRLFASELCLVKSARLAPGGALAQLVGPSPTPPRGCCHRTARQYVSRVAEEVARAAHVDGAGEQGAPAGAPARLDGRLPR